MRPSHAKLTGDGASSLDPPVDEPLADTVAPNDADSNGEGDEDQQDEAGDAARSADRTESRESLWDSEAPLPAFEARGRDSLLELLADELSERPLPEYLDAFEVVIPDAEVVVGSVPLEEVQQREAEVEEAKIRHAELDAELYRQREAHLAHKEALIRARLLDEAQRKLDALTRRERQFAEVVALRSRRIRHVYQQAEAHLTHVLERQQVEVQQTLGECEPSTVPESRRRFRVAWRQVPQTLRVRAERLNAVKDKLPRGQYVLVATLYDRLGGHALHWTTWDPELAQADRSRRTQASRAVRRRPNFTRPFLHRGRFYHTDVAINQSLHVVCPPAAARRPGNVLIFELFQLAADASGEPTGRRRRRRGAIRGAGEEPTDVVVAWGAMPLSTPDFELIRGKFKVPLLRGEMDPTMDKFRDLEQLYQRDLSSWLCNLYFQASRVPTPGVSGSTADADRFDVEIDAQHDLCRLLVENSHQRFIRKLSTMPKSTEPRSVRRRKPITSHDRQTTGDHSIEPPGTTSATMLLEETESDCDLAAKQRTKQPTSSPSRLTLRDLSPLRWLRRLGAAKPRTTRIYSGDMLPSSTLSVPAGTVKTIAEEPPATESGSDSDWEFSDDEAEGELPAGTFDYENYRFSVNAAAVAETASQQRFHARRKLHYLRHELLVDLGLTNWRTLEFWRLAALLLLACWLRLYVHYATQWVYLRGSRVAVYDFQPQWTTCLVKYTWRSVATSTEVATLALGVLGNTALFAFLALCAALSQRLVGELPSFGSSLIVCVGLATLLDPFLVLAVDVVSHHYDCSSLTECATSLGAADCRCVIGDWFKLYVRFQALEGSGLVGVFLVLVVYAALSSVTLVALYIYLLYVHMNGRMLDVYRRVHAQEQAFFVPHDAELSLPELRVVCEAARRWKGPRGTQRKVFVHEYVLSDPLDAGFEEKTAHVAIYNVELDGQRQLHRHFLRSSDGAVLELFGEVGTGADGTWQDEAVGGASSSLAMLYNILQEHQGEQDAVPLSTMFDAL